MPTDKKAGAGQKLSDERVRATMAQVDVLKTARETLIRERNSAYSQRALADRLGYESHHTAAEIFDSGSGAVVLLGDPEACGRELAERYHLAALAALFDDGAPLPTTGEALARLAVQLGQGNERLLADLGDDGKVNDHAAHEASFLLIMRQAMRGLLGARRAREGGK